MAAWARETLHRIPGSRCRDADFQKSPSDNGPPAAYRQSSPPRAAEGPTRPNCAVTIRVTSRHATAARGRTHRRDIETAERHSILRELIKRRGMDLLVAIESHIAPPQVVGHHQDDIGTLGLWLRPETMVPAFAMQSPPASNTIMRKTNLRFIGPSIEARSGRDEGKYGAAKQ